LQIGYFHLLLLLKLLFFHLHECSFLLIHAKKSDRIAAEGLVTTYVSEDKKIGAVVEVNAETDFVAKNEEFRSFVADVAKQIVEKNPATVEELLEQPSIAEAGKTVGEVLTGKIATIGENMSIRRFERFETNGLIESYIHGDGKIGVLVEVEGKITQKMPLKRHFYFN